MSLIRRNLFGDITRRISSTNSLSRHFRSTLKSRLLLRDDVQTFQKRGIIFKMRNDVPNRVVGYYVTLPSVPDETSENNAFLANIERNEDWPTLSSATAREMYEGTVRMLMEYGATVFEHNELLENDKKLERTFDNILEPLLAEEYDLDYAFHTVALKMLTDWPECSEKAFNVDLYHLKTTVAREQLIKLDNAEFQNALMEIYNNSDLVQDEWKQRLVEWYLLEIRSVGFDVQDKKKRALLGSWSRFIGEFSTKYITNIICTNDQNVFHVHKREALKHAPPHILKLLAAGSENPEVGPWRARMEPKTVYALMRYCGDRQTRAAAWDSWTGKAAFEHDFYNNSVIIEELRHNSEGFAKALGYSSISDHHLANKMAGTSETVRSFLNEVTRRIRPVFIDRTRSWSHFATNHEMIGGNLRQSDLFYLCPREAEAHYGTNTLELMNHFPFWETFQNATEILSHLLNLTFQNISDNNLERCHSSVRIYAVHDRSRGEHLGRIYIDPFERVGKRGSWQSFLARPANSVRKLDKIVYMICAGNEPDQSGQSLLHHSQLQSLLFQLGRSVQLLLSQSPYREITIPWMPRFAADWDGADYFPKFVECFVYKPNLLKALSSPNVLTGEELQDTKSDAVSLALSRATLWETYRTLFWADYDLSICELEDRRKQFWFDMYRELIAEYFPFPRERYDYHPCSFIPIFTKPFMSMYYRKLWTEMLALDIHDTFFREKDELSTGERLKNTILYRGAGESQSQLYRMFQGRDPSVGPICDFHDPPAQIED